MSDREELTLHIRKVSGELVRIGWYRYSGDIEYQIAANHLDDVVASVRKALFEFVRNYIADPKSSSASLSMAKVLSKGNDLFESLFLSTDRRDAARDAKEQYYEVSSAGQLELSVKVDPGLTYPWALAVPDPTGFDEVCNNLTIPHDKFWGLRHRLTISTFGAGRARQVPLNDAEYRAAAAMNKSLFDQATAAATSPHEKSALDGVSRWFGDALTFTTSDFLETIREMSVDPNTKLRIAYMLGHAAGDRFQLSKDDEISAGTLAVRLGDTSSLLHRQQTFLFLNGCDTAAEGERFAFTDLLRYPNISGIVGTEVRVPDRFAFRFALAFFRMVIYERVSFRDAMNHLRRAHLPVSLVYTLYASDEISLLSSREIANSTDEIVSENFSEGQLRYAQ
ncbi:UNVERIFIED_ORG: hypothetical protein J2Y81_002153 [Paraburkholderia sediminicola]|uniref:hypothetical protein n=1 Tax=Paraburkholderia aspalathi TaxID=1324617 RepID=UPI0021127A6C|nr:hypothetical protein [Paraburkholderia sediminicola]